MIYEVTYLDGTGKVETVLAKSDSSPEMRGGWVIFSGWGYIPEDRIILIKVAPGAVDTGDCCGGGCGGRDMS